MNIRYFTSCALLLISLVGCNSKKSQENQTYLNDKFNKEKRLIDSSGVQIENDNSLNNKIKDYLNDKFLTDEDKRVISERDRKFKFYEIDLNEDGKNEIFVNLTSPYFCGTGGCTILLLSNGLELITKFTVTNSPIFVEPTLKNGWKILSVYSNTEWKQLVYSDGKYPSNPSVLKKAPYDAPSGHAEMIFGENEPSEFNEF